MSGKSTNPRISACVLAAGRSSRFGTSKLTAQLLGKPLLHYSLEAARDVFEKRVHVVVGYDQDSIIRAAAGLSDNVVINAAYEKGMGSSIAAGVRACRDDSDAILIMLADQPLVTAVHLRSLCDSWSGAATEIVATSFDETIGPPIIFPQQAFDALCDLSDDTGAKKLLANNEFSVQTVEFPPARLDVDTPEDLQYIYAESL